jgi:tRNA(Ile)-lysidine synthase
MKGIPAIKGNIVRPLYSFTKLEILDYARRTGIEFRHDASNNEHKYDRNFVRLKVLPLLKEINENVERTLMRNSRHFEQEGAIVDRYISSRREKIVISGTEAEVRLDKKSLQEEPFLETVLHGILGEYGFSDTQEQNIIRNLRAEVQAGKLFESPCYTLTVDRQAIIIRTKAGRENAAMSIHDLKDLENVPGFRVRLGQRFALPSKNDLYLKASDLVFPLELRKRLEGDKFRPYGMKGFKLVSDFFKDEKLNWFEKNECLLLVNGNSDIIWVAGLRSDDRYKVDEQDVDLIKITFEQ